MIEVYYKGNRIASQKRLYGHSGQYSTVDEHMPEKHRQYTQWNAERFIKRACDIGPYTEQTVKVIIASRKVDSKAIKPVLLSLNWPIPIQRSGWKGLVKKPSFTIPAPALEASKPS